MTNPFYKYSLLTGFVCLIGAAISWFANALNYNGPLLIVGLLLIALGMRGYEKLKVFSYPTVIFAMVGIGMFYAQYLVQAGDFKFSKLILPFLFMWFAKARPKLTQHGPSSALAVW